MATVPASPLVTDIASELATLQKTPKIQGVYSQWLDNVYIVWVGIRDDNDAARKAVYLLEDEVSESFPQVLFDFHVIALPNGRKTRDYISNAHEVFQRSA